ncbi:GAF and ANTAR domain-containing protein [Amycolatopsis sp. FDAARGOS 1241]|uniref:GAF and ANTAR domain-containing protein n=1 Tax=Amycolatopsis sp. FDAARGOS 1241 TaxID=2778070 RepID=UPI00194E7BE5|nr:GAF and ANTAR domain-containing protein [Amycolatopsis sp. FDAARGOS 1241]QRP48242.1 GAF and ANTAR domain-containing protein [Amycolatopsis sp. FDAARGOS 1241]
MTSEQEWQRDKALFVEDKGGHADGPGLLAGQFAELTARLLTAPTVDDVLRRVLEATTLMVPSADLASFTLIGRDGRYHTPEETDEVAIELDLLQYRFREGPCVEAADPAGPAVAVAPDLATEPRWPRWAPAATELGIRAVISTALIPGPPAGPSIGALNVYSRTTNGLDKADRDVLLLLATHASLALATTDAVTRAELEAAHLREAIASRDVIGQAKGIIMARRGVSADEAFDLLRRTSQDLNIKLAELARTLADRHTELDLPLR